MTEKILAAHAGREHVVPGEIVVVDVDRAVPHDLSFYDGMWVELSSVWDPDRIAIIFDHIVPAHDEQSVRALERGRAFAARHGIRALHDVGPEMGICHQVIADVPYARPGEILVCADSHTCSGGVLNCAARGVGIPELIYVMAKGQTWFEVGETVRYELAGQMRPGVAAKDVFLHLAGTYGQHVGQNVEFGGVGLAALRFDQRRQLATMCAEVNAEFALFEPDDVLADYLAARGLDAGAVVHPDPGADYAAVRELDLGGIRPMVGLPDTLVDNTVPLPEAAGVAVNRAFIGSCANGTLEDLRDAARVLRGRRVGPGVTLLVTPASQAVYRQAAAEGLLALLAEAGAVITSSSCGMCAGFQGRLGADDVCITSSTRNFKGRMGNPDAKIYIGSSATVAASAVAGRITDPGDLVGVAG